MFDKLPPTTTAKEKFIVENYDLIFQSPLSDAPKRKLEDTKYDAKRRCRFCGKVVII